MKDPNAVYVAAILCSLPIAALLTHGVYQALRVRHGETWVALGSPVLFSKGAAGNGFEFQKWLYSFGWRRLGDGVLASRCIALFAFHVAYFSSFAFVFIRVVGGGAQ